MGEGKENMKFLLGILVINRPKTTDMCLGNLLRNTPRERVTIIVVDQNSDGETRKVLQDYTSGVDKIIWNDFNTGLGFGVNKWMSERKEGQHCIQIDQDCIIQDNRWLDLFETIVKEPDIGAVAAHRRTAWVDRPDKFMMLRSDIEIEKRQDIFLEVAISNILLTPLYLYKGEILDKLGFANEVTSYDDLDWSKRIHALGFKSVYIPDIHITQPEFEKQTHPQYGSHLALMGKMEGYQQECLRRYLRGQVYLGTRFKPETVKDTEYKDLSEESWKFLQTWRAQ